MDGVESSYGMKQNSPYTMIFSTSSSFSVNKTGVLEKSTDFATVHVSYGTSPDSGSLKEYDVICMNPDGFAIYCNITLSYGIFFSPDTYNDYGAWYVKSAGNIDYNVVYNNSYELFVKHE